MNLEEDITKNPLYMVYNEVKQLPIAEHPERRREFIQILLQELENLGYE